MRPQAASKSSEKPPQAAAPGNCEDDLLGITAGTLGILLKLSQGQFWRVVPPNRRAAHGSPQVLLHHPCEFISKLTS